MRRRIAMMLGVTAAVSGVLFASPAAASAAPTSHPSTTAVAQEGLQGPWSTEGDCQRARALWGGRTSNCFRPGVLWGPWYFVGY